MASNDRNWELLKQGEREKGKSQKTTKYYAQYLNVRIICTQNISIAQHTLLTNLYTYSLNLKEWLKKKNNDNLGHCVYNEFPKNTKKQNELIISDCEYAYDFIVDKEINIWVYLFNKC